MTGNTMTAKKCLVACVCVCISLFFSHKALCYELTETGIKDTTLT